MTLSVSSLTNVTLTASISFLFINFSFIVFINSTEAEKRPNFDQIIEELEEILKKEKEGKSEKKNSRFFGSLMGSGRKSNSSENKRKLIDRHSTWF